MIGVFRMSKSTRGMTDDNASFCEEENVVLRPIIRCFPFVQQRYNIRQAHCPPMSANVRQRVLNICKCVNSIVFLCALENTQYTQYTQLIF